MAIANLSFYPANPNNPTPLPPANESVARVMADDKKIGPGLTLKVMAGDRVNIYATSWYKNSTTPVNSLPVLAADLVAAFSSGITALPGGEGAAGYLSASSGPFFQDIASFLNNQDQSAASGKPKAFVNWILFDEQFQFVESSSNFEQVFDEADYVDGNGDPVVKAHVITGLPMAKSGYLFVFVSNGSTNVPVYFDDLQVSHVRSPLVEETHYYPFGLTMQGISSKAAGSLTNRYKFNGGNELQSQEFSDGSGLELYDAKHRMYDPQIGRFGQIDPLSFLSKTFSPYTFASDNPILRNDPLGLKDTVINGKTAHIDKPSPEVVITYTKIPDGFWAKQNLYYSIMAQLNRRHATIDQIVQPSLRDMMYRFDGITKFRERVNDMTHASDLYVWGTFLAFIAIVEGGFIIGSEVISLTELEDIIATIRIELEAAPYNLNALLNTKYNDLVRVVLGFMAQKQMGLEDFARYMAALNSTRDWKKDFDALKKVWDLMQNIQKLK